MDAKLDEELVAKYPMLYAQRHMSMRETCMCWGFECGDGWHDIIDGLSAKLEAINRKIMDRNALFPKTKVPLVEATQVKEKFGTLRFYADYPAEVEDEVDALISDAEAASARTCETCGKPGETRPGGWVMTLCDDCMRRSGTTRRGMKNLEGQEGGKA